MTVFTVHPDGDGPYPIYCVVPDLFSRSGEKLSFDPSQMGDPDVRERLMQIVLTGPLQVRCRLGRAAVNEPERQADEEQ
jgi:hypothetical protein